MKYLYTILITLLTYSFSYSQDTLYVVPEGAEPNYPNISTALDSANSGDIILVTSGSYSDVITIDKSVTIAPLSQGENYYINNNLRFNLINEISDLPTIYDVDITGAIFSSHISYINDGNDRNVFNLSFISCDFSSTAYFHSRNIFFNSYYSYFNSQIRVAGLGDLIGNEFTTNELKEFQIWYEGENHMINQKPANIIANKFLNYQINFSYSSNDVSHKTSNFHISNNSFDATYSASFDYPFFQFSQTPNISPFLIENNIFNCAQKGDQYGYLLSCYSSSNSGQDSKVNVMMRNNFIFRPLDNYTDGVYDTRLFSANSNENFKLINNYFNKDVESFDDCFMLSSSEYVIPGSFIQTNNYFDSDLESVEFDSLLTNTPTYLIDKGVNLIECRDIDNTKNDIGVLGGPNSWLNFHSGSGARVVRLNMPSTIAPGMNISITGKGVNVND